MNTLPLVATVELINDKVKFNCQSRTNTPVTVDYTPPIGDGEGYTSLELLLISLSTCVGTAIAAGLRRMQKTIASLTIESHGYRRDEHPTGFRNIELMINMRSPDITSVDMEKVLGTLEKICPVLSMLSEQVKVEFTYCINETTWANVR